MILVNRRAVAYQVLIFSSQWILMLVGFGLISQYIAPYKIVDSNLPLGGYFDASIKASFALILSVAWLFLWDRQVRVLFYRRSR